MNMKLILKAAVTLSVVTVFLAPSAQAQTTPGGIEIRKDRIDRSEARDDRRDLYRDGQERADSTREVRDDRKDLMKIDALISRFDVARRRKDRRSLSEVDQDLRKYVKQELRETHRELSQDRAEVNRSANEVRRDQRENYENRVEGASYRERRDDRRDTRDDRRDLRDDVRDARQEAWMMKQVREVAGQLEPLYGKTDPRRLEQKRHLMLKLEKLAKGELRETIEEVREDRKETREDRRELQEDRRNTNPNGWR